MNRSSRTRFGQGWRAGTSDMSTSPTRKRRVLRVPCHREAREVKRFPGNQCLTGPWPQRPARQRARAHAKTRAERWRHVLQELAAAGTAAIVADGIRSISAHPLATSFALRVDALHGKAGKILHAFPLRGCSFEPTGYGRRCQHLDSPCGQDPFPRRAGPETCWRGL
jgi:hypothetical protein